MCIRDRYGTEQIRNVVLLGHGGAGKTTVSEALALLTGVTTVSYTHLDVYKRQAVGVAFAGLLSQNGTITMAGALALSVGIAIQNFPEGAIISLPLKEAAGKGKAFIYGTLSGVVEPIGALLMLVLAEFLGPVLPYFLSFAAGAMIYVVVEELIPESAEGEHSNVATIGFAVGFVVMMILDVALG